MNTHYLGGFDHHLHPHNSLVLNSVSLKKKKKRLKCVENINRDLLESLILS